MVVWLVEALRDKNLKEERWVLGGELEDKVCQSDQDGEAPLNLSASGNPLEPSLCQWPHSTANWMISVDLRRVDAVEDARS